MDKLELNLADVPENLPDFLNELREWLDFQGITANGIFRKEVDPETGEDEVRILFINNIPVLPGREVKYEHDNVGELQGINFGEPLKSWQDGDNNTSHYRDFRAGGSSDGSRPKA